MVATRATQVVELVGVKYAPPSRATQAVELVGVRYGAPIHATQVIELVGVKFERPPCLTQEADCWRIERRDGVVFRFTSHNRYLVLNGESYQPCASLSASALQLSSETGQAGDIDLVGIISSAGVKESDLWAGVFDGAAVEVWRAPWVEGATEPKLVAAGTAGALEFGDTGYKYTVVTAGERLQQRPLLSPVTASCRFKLGDSRCGVDLAPLTLTGAVTAVSGVNLFTQARRRVFTDTSRGEAAAWWALGSVLWTSGANAGQRVDVKTFAAGGGFVLAQACQFDIQVGDAYSAIPGDDKLLTTCDVKFANAINFGGFPYLSGSDQLGQTPIVKT